MQESLKAKLDMFMCNTIYNVQLSKQEKGGSTVQGLNTLTTLTCKRAMTCNNAGSHSKI